jgi:peptidyl-prolyl cis-trans isomerase SurA
MWIRTLALGVGLALPAAFAADTVVVEHIVAKVNGDIVTRSELEKSKRQMEASIRQRGGPPQQVNEAIQEAARDTLRDKIDDLLLVQRGKELNINVDSELSKFLANIQLENKLSDPEKFQQWIREQTGMSFEDFKQETKNNIMRQRVIGQEVISKTAMPKSEIEDYYNKNKEKFIRKEQVFLREILVGANMKDPAAAAAAEKKAKDIVARARKGEKFGDLVRDNSDAVTAKQGGDLGGFQKGVLRPDIEGQIWEKPKGYVTDPIKVDAGFLILRVEDHQKEGQAELAEVENEIRETLGSQIVGPKIRQYLTELRQAAFLEIREGYVDSGAATGKDTRWVDPAVLKPETITKEEVANQKRMKRALWVFPIPGTTTDDTRKSSSK